MFSKLLFVRCQQNVTCRIPNDSKNKWNVLNIPLPDNKVLRNFGHNVIFNHSENAITEIGFRIILPGDHGVDLSRESSFRLTMIKVGGR